MRSEWPVLQNTRNYEKKSSRIRYEKFNRKCYSTNMWTQSKKLKTRKMWQIINSMILPKWHDTMWAAFNSCYITQNIRIKEIKKSRRQLKRYKKSVYWNQSRKCCKSRERHSIFKIKTHTESQIAMTRKEPFHDIP